MQNVRFTAIIPTCDRPPVFFEAALCSVARQTRSPFEVIVVDNGYFPVEMPLGLQLEISYIRPGIHIGASAARNVGIQAARTELIAFLDDDDEWDSTYLEEMYKVMGDGQASVTVGSLYRKVNGDISLFKCPSESELTPRLLMHSNPGFGGSNICVALPAARQVGGFNPSLSVSEDRDFAIRLLTHGWQITSVPQAKVYYREHSYRRLTGNHFLKIPFYIYNYKLVPSIDLIRLIIESVSRGISNLIWRIIRYSARTVKQILKKR